MISNVYHDYLERLHLTDYFPGQISLRDVQAQWSRTCDSAADLPWVIMRQILMGDYRARDDEVKRINEQLKQVAHKPAASKLGFSIRKGGYSKQKEKCLHPMDVLVTVIACCDHLLRQILHKKLFVCRLAIPLVIPCADMGAEFLIWALRSIVYEWEDTPNSGEAIETSAVSTLVPIVSFVRLGELDSSKSSLINSILGSKNNTFFNKECPGGRNTRTISDGVIELSWHFPTHESVLKPVAYLNLRGNVQTLEEKTNMLIGISDVVILVTKITIFANRDEVRKFEQFVKFSKFVIVILCLDKDSTEIQDDIQDCLENITEKFEKKLKMIPAFEANEENNHLEEKNKDELKTEIIKELNQLNKPSKSLQEVSKQISGFRMIADESDSQCDTGNNLYHQLWQANNNKPIPEVKQSLTLQRDNWIKWVQLTKKVQKSECFSESEREDIFAEKQQLRQNQVELYQSGSELMKEFISILQNPENEIYINNFLQWLKIDLDDMSRQSLPVISKTYCQIREELKKINTSSVVNAEMKTELLDKLHKTEQSLVNASLGLEHFFREISQIHESFHACRKVNEIPNLAKMMANLILKGHPFEIMDGDEGCVPIDWLCAVFKELKLLLGDKKIFVLSVLGVQSSGKSTLLNAMFGLEFAVSAGRCTRGIFAQLIEPGANKYPFDYILVVDTEGLRSSELRQTNYDHDNALATLVLGIGNITIINLKGENTAEISDVLQIAVHAFLKLKVANRCNDLYNQCLFVHQNVSAVSAKSKMMLAQQRLQDTLDEMTKEAAKHENITHINQFNQVIQFDGVNHIWMFPDLWEGEPSMASINPSYVGKVAMLRNEILENMSVKIKSFTTIDETLLRIRDLWEGISSMDFVFSFRNTLEVKAYDHLEMTYTSLTWEVEENVQTWYNKSAKPDILRCKTKKDIDETCDRLLEEIQAKINVEEQLASKKLATFIDKHSNKSIMLQWRDLKFKYLPKAMSEILYHLKMQLQKDRESQHVDIQSINDENKYVQGIMKVAAETAQQYRNADPSKIDEAFETFWKSELDRLPSMDTTVNVDIESYFVETFYKVFASDRHLVSEELKQLPISWQKSKPSTAFKITIKHVSSNRRWIVRQWKANKDIEEAEADTRQLLTSQELFISNICKQSGDIQRDHIRKIVANIEKAIDKLNSRPDSKYQFLTSYKVYITVLLGSYAIATLTNHQCEFNKVNSLEAKLEKWKGTCKSLFVNEVQQKSGEIFAVEYMCERLKDAVKSAVERQLPLATTSKILSYFCHQKYHLVIDILEGLAKEQNFEDICIYVRDPSSYAEQWLTSFTDKFMFEKTGNATKYAEVAESIVEELITGIISVTRTVTETFLSTEKTEQGFSKWIGLFLAQLDKQVVLTDDLHVIANSDISNLKSLGKEFERKLLILRNEIADDFSNTSSTNVKWLNEPPYGRIYEKLWGCKAKCPFCGEPCQDTDANHYADGDGTPHRVIQHKPKGISAWHWSNTDKLVTDHCSYLVSGNGPFRCGYPCVQYGTCAKADENVYHEYKNYKSIFPSWDIAPNPNPDSASFWKFIFKEYNTALSVKHGLKEADIPKSWTHISLKEAIDSLRKVFKIYE